jgi:hypothetical protein
VIGPGRLSEFLSDVRRIREVAIGPAGSVRIEMRLAPFGQIEISGPDIPRVSAEHIGSAVQRANREKVEARTAAA